MSAGSNLVGRGGCRCSVRRPLSGALPAAADGQITGPAGVRCAVGQVPEGTHQSRWSCGMRNPERQEAARHAVARSAGVCRDLGIDAAYALPGPRPHRRSEGGVASCVWRSIRRRPQRVINGLRTITGALPDAASGAGEPFLVRPAVVPEGTGRRDLPPRSWLGTASVGRQPRARQTTLASTRRHRLVTVGHWLQRDRSPVRRGRGSGGIHERSGESPGSTRSVEWCRVVTGSGPRRRPVVRGDVRLSWR